MKRLTGGDPITGRRMRKDNITFDPSHSTILITNHLPEVLGNDPAIWRRIRVVEFGVTIPEDQRDGTLGDRLKLAADEIIAWAVGGLQAYREIGLAEPEMVRAATNAYRAEMDVLARFIAEKCVTVPNARVKTSDFFTAWDGWRESEVLPEVSRQVLARNLRAAGYERKKTLGAEYWFGLGIKADQADR